MGGDQLRVREVRPFGSVAKYSGLDLGRDQGSGRGEVIATFFRESVNAAGVKSYECFTFVPDTIHNRLQLLQRNVELAEWVGEWVLVGKESIEGYLAPAKALFTARAAIDGADLVAGVGSAEVGVEKPAPVVVSGLSDFLQLKKETQLELLAREDFGEDALKEILDCTDPRLSKKVREAAIAKADKLVAPKA
jgi:hypothetical protein